MSADERHMKLAEETLDLILCNVPEAGDVREASIRDIASALSAERERAWKAGYLAGFNAAGEGYNGEYPFADQGRSQETSEIWSIGRDISFSAASRGEG